MHEPSGRFERRNFLLNLTEGALFLSGAAFISSQTVLTALVVRLGGSDVAVGAVSVIVWVGLFLPQILAARYTEALPWKKPWTVHLGLAQRMVILLMGLVVVAFGASQPSAALVLFLGLLLLNQVALGIITPGWYDLFGKLTPTGKRGRLVGMRSALGGIGGLLCGVVLSWMLEDLAFPLNYALAFGGAFLLQLAAVLVQWNLVEEEPSTVQARRPVGEFLRRLPEVFRADREFAVFLFAAVFLVLGTMPMAFYTVFALQKFELGEAAVGQFTLLIVASQVIGSPFSGLMADRWGNKATLIAAACCLLGASITALLAPSPEWYLLVFVFLGINLGSDLMARYNIAIEYGPPEQRSVYIGLMNTVLAPFFLCGLLGGWISTLHGYPAVFAGGAVFSLAGILLLLFAVKDPRHAAAGSSAPGELRLPSRPLPDDHAYGSHKTGV